MKLAFNVISMAALLGALLISPVSADDNAEAFKKLDTNGDGFISEYEALEHSSLPEVFEESDENGDGQLDVIEFAKLEIIED